MRSVFDTESRSTQQNQHDPYVFVVADNRPSSAQMFIDVHHVRHWTEGDDESRIPPDHLISFRLKIWDFCWHEGVQINFSLAFLTRVLGQDPPTSWAKMEWFAEKVEPSATCPTKPNASTFTLCDVWPKTYLPIPEIWHGGNSSDLFRWAKRRTDNNNPKHRKCYSCENALWLTSNLCPHWS